MGLFTRKSKEPVVSAFDSVPQEITDSVIQDTMAIIRMMKTWPARMFPNPEKRSKAGAELQSMLRKVGFAAAGIAASMGDDDSMPDAMSMLTKLPIPQSLRPLVVAIYTTFVE